MRTFSLCKRLSCTDKIFGSPLKASSLTKYIPYILTACVILKRESLVWMKNKVISTISNTPGFPFVLGIPGESTLFQKLENAVPFSFTFVHTPLITDPQ
jgi:hypothetical protein